MECGGWSDRGYHKVCHRSLPHRKPPVYANIEELISENCAEYEIYFILTTRDISISEVSRMHRLAKPLSDTRTESDKAREIMIAVINSGYKYFVWSYETFMYLDKYYLKDLYSFIGVESDFIPDLYDANRKKTVVNSLQTRIFDFFLKLRKNIKIFLKRIH